jgi:hypothetical protein
VYSRRVPTTALVNCFLFFLLLGWTTLAQGKDLALISNKSNEVVAVTMPELVKVCKGQVSRWPDGKPVSEGDDRERESQPGESSGDCGGGIRRSGGEESRIGSGRGRLGGCVFDQRRSDGVEGRWKIAAGAGVSIARELESMAFRGRPSGGFYLQFETG